MVSGDEYKQTYREPLLNVVIEISEKYSKKLIPNTITYEYSYIKDKIFGYFDV